MITTTAAVSALACLEALKLRLGAGLDLHRNAFVNLALPFFAFARPAPAPTRRGPQGFGKFNLWDKILVQETEKMAKRGGISVRRLLRQVRKSRREKEGGPAWNVGSLSWGSRILYADFLHGEDAELLETSLWDVARDAMLEEDEEEFRDDREEEEGNGPLTEEEREALVKDLGRRKFVDLMASAVDQESGEEVELPPVRVVRWKKES
mmetsp:Transcript_39393/g.91978  ORF Transcript_39393/g.91978 Transcript_39393/m.91978 type:complete len:208 (-) Transcript_39393:126-749(-)